MDWMHGYYAHSGYSFGYYPETMPVRLRWAGLLHRHNVPEKNFRYLDAGFGQGVNLILAASMHPDSEFVGIDFMPEHVAHAKKLVEKLGLDNVTLIEGDFVELAKDPSSLGEFDMVVCHGIATWIGPDVKAALFDLIGQVLKPGGIFYNSYNTFPGWLGISPFQHLVLLKERSSSGFESITGARQTMEALNAATDLMFKAYPNLPARLKTLDNQDPAYLMQEYNNSHWQPLYVSQMMDAMAAVKIEFLGTATLPDAFDNVLKPEVREVIQKETNPILREQVRDYATLQSFRRDIYVKGKVKMWDVQYNDAVRATRVILNPLVARPAAGDPYKIQGSTVELLGNADVYTALLDKIGAHSDGVTIGELIESEADARRKNTLVETLSMMLHGSWINFQIDNANPRGPEIALALANEACSGAPYRQLPMPGCGIAFRFNDTDLVLIKLAVEKVPQEQVGPALVAILGKLGRQLAKEGKPVTDDGERQALIDSLIAEFGEKKLPYLKKVGML